MTTPAGLNLVSVAALAVPFWVDDTPVASAGASVIGGSAGFGNAIGARPGFGAIGAASPVASPPTPPAKYAASAETPVLVLWGHLDQLGASDPEWSDRSVVVNARPSWYQYWKVAGFPDPPSTAYYRANHGAGANFNTLVNYKLDVDDTNFGNMISALAASDALQIADVLYKQGLIRGRGPYGSGNYGGTVVHHELFGSQNFADAQACAAWSTLMYNPDDAALVSRTQTLKTGPSTTRSSTLFKLTIGGGPPSPGIDTEAHRAAVESQTDGCRPGNFFHLVNTNGIALARRYTLSLIAQLQAKCDAYETPDGHGTVQLCYPWLWMHDLEEWSYAAHFNATQYITKGVGETDIPSSGYYHEGVLWHLRGDVGSEHAAWTAPAFRNKSGVAMGYSGILLEDPLTAPYATAYFPDVNHDGGNWGGYSATSLAFQKLMRDAVDYSLYQAFNHDWQQAFPHAICSQDDGVIVLDKSNPFKRQGSGALWITTDSLLQDAQAPHVYGAYGPTDPLVAAIKAASTPSEIAAAVAAWNDANLPAVLAEIDKLDRSKPIHPILYGPWRVEDFRADAVNPVGNWGGDATFFRKLIKALYQKGLYHYTVFSGDVAVIRAAWAQAKAEIAVGNFS